MEEHQQRRSTLREEHSPCLGESRRPLPRGTEMDEITDGWGEGRGGGCGGCTYEGSSGEKRETKGSLHFVFLPGRKPKNSQVRFIETGMHESGISNSDVSRLSSCGYERCFNKVFQIQLPSLVGPATRSRHQALKNFVS